MKFLCVLLTIALVALWFGKETRTQRESELAAKVISQRQELGLAAGEINREKRNEAKLQVQEEELQAQLGLFNAYGEASPHHVSATFAKTIADREVNVAIELTCDAKWQCSKESESFPDGRARTERQTEKVRFPARKGMLLGTRSHFVYVLAAFPRDREIKLGWMPKAVTIKPKENLLLPEVCQYFLDKAGVELSFRISSDLGKWVDKDWTVIHAWNQDDMTLLVVGCEDATIPAMDLMPYKSDRDWLADVERTGVLYPVSQLNGCVSLIPTRFDREYGRRGRKEQWSGFPGSIHAIFLPVEDAAKPVLHSLIIQRTESEALWIPAWAEKLQLDASSEQFDLSPFINIRIQSEAGPPRSVVWTSGPAVTAWRLKLLESYLTLMTRAQAI